MVWMEHFDRAIGKIMPHDVLLMFAVLGIVYVLCIFGVWRLTRKNLKKQRHGLLALCTSFSMVTAFYGVSLGFLEANPHFDPYVHWTGADVVSLFAWMAGLLIFVMTPFGFVLFTKNRRIEK